MKKLLLLIILLAPVGCSKKNTANRPPYPLNYQQLAWGEEQLVHLLKDRPAMAAYVQKGDPVWEWMVREFAGEWCEGGIEWDPTDPKPLWDGLYTASNGKRKAFIQVTERSVTKVIHYGQLKSGPYLWFEVVYELSNLRTAPDSARVDGLAYNGKISREEFSFKKFYLEAIQTRGYVHDFFINLWEPNCQKLGLEPYDQWLIDTYNQKMPVFSSKGFIDEYFGFDYSIASQNSSRAIDFAFHHNYFSKIYDTFDVPWMEKMKIPIPANESMVALKQKMMSEHVK